MPSMSCFEHGARCATTSATTTPPAATAVHTGTLFAPPPPLSSSSSAPDFFPAVDSETETGESGRGSPAVWRAARTPLGPPGLQAPGPLDQGPRSLLQRHHCLHLRLEPAGRAAGRVRRALRAGHADGGRVDTADWASVRELP
eukprot:188710-Rhodomonas_salina.2